MAAWRRDQGGYDSDEVIVHVAWIAERTCAGRHDGRDLERVSMPRDAGYSNRDRTYKLVGLLERRFLYMQSVCSYP